MRLALVWFVLDERVERKWAKRTSTESERAEIGWTETSVRRKEIKSIE
jgi:hypothetical protein